MYGNYSRFTNFLLDNKFMFSLDFDKTPEYEEIKINTNFLYQFLLEDDLHTYFQSSYSDYEQTKQNVTPSLES